MALVADLHAVITDLERTLDIADDVIAGAVGVDPRSVGRWRVGETFPQKGPRARLDQLSNLKVRLYETFSSAEAVQAWMHTNSRYLGHLKPAEAARAGRLDRVIAALDAFDAGLFI